MKDIINGVAVSIIVPVYNAHKYLSNCISSVLAQSYNNIELILVDDCSQDNSMDILREYQVIDKRVRILRHKCNLGPMRARDNGCNEASGEWVVFLDADDWLPVDAIEKLLSIAQNTQADIVCGVMEGRSSIGEVCSRFENTLPFGDSSDGIIKALVHGYLHHNLAGKLFKKSLFDHDIKIFDNNTNAEDALVFYQIVENVRIMALMSDVVYYYAQGTSATPRGQKMSEKQLYNICLFWTYLFGEFLRRHPEHEQIVFDKTFPVIAEKLKQGFAKKAIYSNIKVDIDLDNIFNNSYILNKSHGIMKVVNLLLFNFPPFGKVCSYLLTIKNNL